MNLRWPGRTPRQSRPRSDATPSPRASARARCVIADPDPQGCHLRLLADADGRGRHVGSPRCPHRRPRPLGARRGAATLPGGRQGCPRYRLRVQGIVILEAIIDPSGSVTNVRVLRSIPLLDQSAIDAVRQWKYQPTLLNGVPVPIVMTVTVNFSLS